MNKNYHDYNSIIKSYECGRVFIVKFISLIFINLMIVICECPSAGHDAVMLDYSKCGKDGEPEVIHVDVERDDTITVLAKDFSTFILGLKNIDEFKF